MHALEVGAHRGIVIAQLHLPERDVPADVAVEQSFPRIVGQPFLQELQSGFLFAGFVVHVRLHVRAVCAPRVELHRALDRLPRALDVAGFHAREGELGKKERILVPMRREFFQELPHLLLAPFAAGKADQPEDAAAWREHHRVARVLLQVLAREGVGLGRAAFDGEDDDFDVVLLALRQVLRQLARHQRGGLRFGHLRHHEQRARLAGVGEREAGILSDGPLKGLLGVWLAASSSASALAISVTRLLRLRGEREFAHPRSLNRWIFPVAVLGRSVANSIQRGYLYGASFAFTCALSSSSVAFAPFLSTT